jgi:ferritin heavy chain
MNVITQSSFQGHAEYLLKYQNTRGGRIVLDDVKKPEKDEWGSALEAFESALKLERFNNESLLSLHNIASEANDATVIAF